MDGEDSSDGGAGSGSFGVGGGRRHGLRDADAAGGGFLTEKGEAIGRLLLVIVFS